MFHFDLWKLGAKTERLCSHIFKISAVLVSISLWSQDTVFNSCSPPRDSGCLIDTSCWHNVQLITQESIRCESLCRCKNPFFQPEQQYWFMWEMALIKHIHGCQAIMRNHLTPPGDICEANISWERPVIRHNCRDLMVILIPWESFTF